LECQLEGIRKFKVLVWLLIFEEKQEVASDSRCNVMIAEVMSKDMGVGENGAKM
jgi:hypothetical protein